MRLTDVVNFRKDLLFEGAVQLGWFENDRQLADKVAEHFVFHGPKYHGIASGDTRESYSLVDTATFALDVMKRVSGQNGDDPFTIAIAGYGTGKSHLALTLSCLLSDPKSRVAEKILANIRMADADIGAQARDLMNGSAQPFLVVTLNGAQDFDLSAEIIRQVLGTLTRLGLDTTALDDLRPRFKTAINFTESFFAAISDDFAAAFGSPCSLSRILDDLGCQNEETFRKVSDVYERKMGSPIHAAGQESLHDFIRVAKSVYCGPNRPFAGIVVIFDEFGRYLEFSVQKPHIAGSGALQQLFECVQANSDGVFLLSFIQYEPKAYMSRVGAERRDELNRYVTRYDAVRKVQLSTNLETLIANLLEKKDQAALEKHLAQVNSDSSSIQLRLQHWFPDMTRHALWTDEARFSKVISEGCWPLHPASTWTLYRLTSIGKSLQQRSALSLLADAYRQFGDQDFGFDETIRPVDLCSETLISEFHVSERYGQQGANASAYKDVTAKYGDVFSENEHSVMKAVLLSSKIGVRVESKRDCVEMVAVLCGLDPGSAETALELLEREYAVLEWNALLNQYEIVTDAVPRSKFLAQLRSEASSIDSAKRARIFAQKCIQWGIVADVYQTDFGAESRIFTREWNYKAYGSDISMLDQQIGFAVKTWREATGVDKEKGHLIYCYVGPESSIELVKQKTDRTMRSVMSDNGLDCDAGLPLAVLFINDADGSFGERIAERFILDNHLDDSEMERYRPTMLDRKISLEQEMANQLRQLEGERNLALAVPERAPSSRLSDVLNSLFKVVYPKRVPFPFDGFHTARGNAAKDSADFTRALFMGNFDREWMSNTNRQQLNRAHEVLVDAWGLIADDGRLKRFPSGAEVLNVVELFERRLQGEDDHGEAPINLGDAMRLLCMPPYGCNIASAGLLLAYFVGSRKDRIQLFRDQEPVSTEIWLQDAMLGSFLSIPVLDTTTIVRVSEESISEWELLLDQWESATILVAKKDFLCKSHELQKRIPLPPQLHYRHKLLESESRMAVQRLNEYEHNLNVAWDRIQKGIERDDIPQLSWAGADLVGLSRDMTRNRAEWTQEQLDEVKRACVTARREVQSRFASWLPSLWVKRIEDLGKFKHVMINNVCSSLSALSLDSEREQLEAHVNRIAANIELIAELRRTALDVQRMVTTNVVTSATKVSVVYDWIQQAESLDERLKKAQQMSDIDQNDALSASRALREYIRSCERTLAAQTERMNMVYQISQLDSLSEIGYWRNEVADLMHVYEGYDKDIDDLKAVQRQLKLIETHYRQLDDDSLDNYTFRALCEQCRDQNDLAFRDDAPPLDNAHIYESMTRSITSMREAKAAAWMSANVPAIENIENADAHATVAYRSRLREMPQLLSEEQQGRVRETLRACEMRLDALEVEGVLAQFMALSPANKKAFLNRIAEHTEGTPPGFLLHCHS